MADNEFAQAFDAMSPDEHKKLIMEVGRYAASRCQNLSWRTGNHTDIPGGETPASIVSKAFEKSWSGERRWDPKKQPDLKAHLLDTIKSMLNHLAESLENRILKPLDDPSNEERTEIQTEAPRKQSNEPAMDWLARRSLSPEEILLQKETEKELAARNERALNLLREEVKVDPILKQFIELKLNDYDDYGEIARIIGVQVKDVYNAAKRLDRLLIKVRRRVLNS